MNEENKNIVLTLDINTINIILAGLGKLPLEGSLGVYTQIRQQVEEQFKKPEGPLSDKIISNKHG